MSTRLTSITRTLKYDGVEIDKAVTVSVPEEIVARTVEVIVETGK